MNRPVFPRTTGDGGDDELVDLRLELSKQPGLEECVLTLPSRMRHLEVTGGLPNVGVAKERATYDVPSNAAQPLPGGDPIVWPQVRGGDPPPLGQHLMVTRELNAHTSFAGVLGRRVRRA